MGVTKEMLLMAAAFGGGSSGPQVVQPSAFPPVVTGGYNQISWETDSRNGGFGATTTATLDGDAVTSPLTITAAMEDKHLIITTAAQNFQSASTDILIYYMSAQASLLAISDGTEGTGYGLAFDVSDIDKLRPQGYASYSGSTYYSSTLTADSQGAASGTLSFSLAALSSEHPSSVKVYAVDADKNVIRGNIAFTVTKNGTSVYTASVSDDAAELTIPGTVSWEAGDDIEVIVNATIITPSATVIGFTGLTNASGNLTYTDDIANFAAPTSAASGNNVNVTSDLDYVFPFSEISEMTDADGNVFVKFPKLYMNWVVDANGNIDGVKISDEAIDENSFIPDAYLDPKDSTCSTYLDYFALGKYEASGTSSKMYSKSGQTCLVNVTRDNCRTAARAYGNAGNNYNGYQQIDFSMFVVYNFLCMLYYKTSNIQSIYGGRTGSGTHSSWTDAATTGQCDNLVGKNGWEIVNDCVKMLGIENPYGNIFKWVDGVMFDGQAIYAQRLPQDFADTATGNTLGIFRPSSNGYCKYFKQGTADSVRSYAFCTDASASQGSYCDDRYYYGSGLRVLRVGGSWSYTARAGLWFLYGNDVASNAGTYIGARLSYRPL